METCNSKISTTHDTPRLVAHVLSDRTSAFAEAACGYAYEEDLASSAGSIKRARLHDSVNLMNVGCQFIPTFFAERPVLGSSHTREKLTKGKRKIPIEFIHDRARRSSTFSKRKAGMMKKAVELAELTGAEVLLLIASETNHVHTYATKRLRGIIDLECGKELIRTCLSMDVDTMEHIINGRTGGSGPLHDFTDDTEVGHKSPDTVESAESNSSQIANHSPTTLPLDEIAPEPTPVSTSTAGTVKRSSFHKKVCYLVPPKRNGYIPIAPRLENSDHGSECGDPSFCCPNGENNTQASESDPLMSPPTLVSSSVATSDPVTTHTPSLYSLLAVNQPVVLVPQFTDQTAIPVGFAPVWSSLPVSLNANSLNVSVTSTSTATQTVRPSEHPPKITVSPLTRRLLPRKLTTSNITRLKQ